MPIEMLYTPTSRITPRFLSNSARCEALFLPHPDVDGFAQGEPDLPHTCTQTSINDPPAARSNPQSQPKDPLRTFAPGKPNCQARCLVAQYPDLCANPQLRADDLVHLLQFLDRNAAKFLPKVFTESVLIWLIFTNECFDSFVPVTSNVSGKTGPPVSWLVNAQAMTVPERSLTHILAKHRDGRRSDCSWPCQIELRPKYIAPQYSDDSEASFAMPSSAPLLLQRTSRTRARRGYDRDGRASR